MNRVKRYTIFLIILFFCGCGVKKPPLNVKDSTPQDFYFKVKPDPVGFELFIYLPTQTKGGYTLTSIRKLIIEKEEIPLNSPNSKEIYEIDLSPKLHLAANLIIYTDFSVKNDYSYIYRIKIQKDLLVSTSYTKGIKVYWHDPPSLPRDFTVIPYNNDMVLLIWKSPKQDIHGKKLNGRIFYKIERITQNHEKTIEVRNKRYYWDRINNLKKVCYSIRAVLDFKGTLIPGLKTPEICVNKKI